MRNKLIENLLIRWRKAEDYFIQTENDCKKWECLDFQNKQNLTKEELKELNDNLEI